MTVRQLEALFRLIVAEAKTNPVFAEKLMAVFDARNSPQKKTNPVQSTKPDAPGALIGNGDAVSIGKKKGGRRASAVLDPIKHVEEHGVDALTTALTALTIEQLKDVVAEYGMDSMKLVMKWADPARIIEHIVNTSASRARKGNAFR